MNKKTQSVVNWKTAFSYSNIFQNNKPCKWAFIEEFFERDFYEQLYEIYPKYDNSWIHVSREDKTAFRKGWSANPINRDLKEI